MKSIAIVVLAGAAITLAVVAGLFEHATERTVPSAFAIGLFASSAAALVAFGARPTAKSRAALTQRGLVVDLPPAHPGVRELPSIVQRVLLVVTFACLGLRTFTADATARIANLPADLAEPSRSAYCLPEEAKPEAPVVPAAPEPPPVDQAGCALVKRAYALGYAKSLGSCAPREAPKPIVVEDEAEPEVCDRRELDEPLLHYTWRRLVGAASGASPIDKLSAYTEDLRTRVGRLGDLLANIKHSITGTPHGSHHVFITLPDPRPSSVVEYFTGHERCTSIFDDLPLWRTHGPPNELVEHVLGQLLFATRFGTPASCSDYTLHWDAPADACTKIAASPSSVLDAHDALEPIRAVLERRRLLGSLRALQVELGRAPTLPVPPPASAVASIACFVVGGQAGTTGQSIAIDADTIELRELRVQTIGTPLELYEQLATLFAGSTNPATRAPEPFAPGGDDDFPLARLEPLVELDPFVEKAVRPLLEEPAIAEVYPFDRHLHAFVEGFRRVYFAQRGRL